MLDINNPVGVYAFLIVKQTEAEGVVSLMTASIRAAF
jgi:hypothetical protein